MEFSTLNGYKVKDKKAIRFYDNVESMKSDTTLKEGMHVKTKGYYSINDNGDAEYVIKSSSTELYETLDNNLIAEIIIKDEININSLGADNTGTRESSTIIQNALDYINDRWINEKYDINTIVFNGTYLINNTLEMSPFAKLTGKGFVTFKTSISPVIWIHYPNGTIPETFDGNKIQYQYANLIDFPKGCLFKNIDGDKQNTCIEIGEHSDLTTTHNVARFKLSNFAIENYDIGIKYNVYNVYICNHERLHIELNNIAVKLGDRTQTLVNSGEHMLFDNCLIAGSTYAFLYETNGFDIEVVNSSIDFNEFIVSDPYCKGYHKINFSNSHIEGNNHFLGTIGYPSLINIINNKLYWTLNSQETNQFMTLSDVASGVSTTDCKLNICNIKDNWINIPTVGTTYNPEYIYFDSYMNIYENNTFYQSNVIKPQLTNGNVLKGVFDEIEDGDVTISTNSTLNNGKLKIVGNSHIKATAEIVTDNYLYQGHKSLRFFKADDTTSDVNLVIETSLLPAKKDSYIANWISYNKRNGASIRFYFYDKDGNELSQTDAYQYHSTLPSENNEWYSSNFPKKVLVPLNATYYKVVFYLAQWNNGQAEAEDTQYKLGGLIIN